MGRGNRRKRKIEIENKRHPVTSDQKKSYRLTLHNNDSLLLLLAAAAVDDEGGGGGRGADWGKIGLD